MAYERELKLAKQVAQEAGALALDFQRRGVTAELKADESPVTAADRAAERLITSRIAEVFPEDGFLGEEGSNCDGTSGRKWIIDPIDGTRDFVRGIPFWAVLIGLEGENGDVVAAAAFSPGQNLLVAASRGAGAWEDGTRLSVSAKTQPAESILSFNGFNKAGVGVLGHNLLPWVARFGAVRGLGGAVDAMFLAQGRLDVWVEPNAQPWDLAPLKLIVEEAGGRFKSFNGASTIYGGNAYAYAPGLEPYAQQLFAPKP